jgi:MinD-like ATPase involved in chromosome partitioning or flagellar assembly
VIAQAAPAEGSRPSGDHDHRRLFDLLASRYPLVVADPGATSVARALSSADELILVAPASPDAARATGMTLEWLDANGYTALIAGAIAVINGVSKRSVSHAEQAEAVMRGRCRAIVRIPWDDHLGEPPAERGIRGLQAAPGNVSRLDQLRQPVLDAYTALAGVVVSALVVTPARRKAIQ